MAIQAVSGPLASRAGSANNAMRQFGAALGPVVLGGILSLQLTTGGSPLWALRISAIILGSIFSALALVAGILLSRSDRS